MNRVLILEVLKPEDISRLLDEIHDWWFDLDRLGPHIGSAVEIELRPRSDDFYTDEATQRKTLEIDEVTGFEVKDTEGIGCYDVNTIKYEGNSLHIITGVPLGLRFFVRKLRLRLFVSYSGYQS